MSHNFKLEFPIRKGRTVTNPLLQDALEYHHRGWCILPIRVGTKRPACKNWKQFQTVQTTESQLKRWFKNGSHYGLSVVLGEVSGGLVCRDFDDMAAYQQWATSHSDLARALPTVETGRPGRHVYCLGDSQQISSCSPSNGTIIDLGDGELRGGGICVLPPSKHPNGHEYRWLNPPNGKIPFLDLISVGFLSQQPCNRENRENRDNRDNRGLLRQQKNTEVIVSEGEKKDKNRSQITCEKQEIERAILESLPIAPGNRNKQVFELARALKAIPSLADAPADDLKEYVQHWHKLAKPIIRTQPFEETWIDFLRGWPKVKFPKGAEPMVQIFERAVSEQIPKVAEQYEEERIRLLVSLCRELQRAAGDGPFYLSVRTAGRLLGVDHTTASRWLFLLKHDGVLREVSRGSQKSRKASRYQYIAVP
jgi:hypothetical protein